jgi:hypothetical protein
MWRCYIDGRLAHIRDAGAQRSDLFGSQSEVTVNVVMAFQNFT